MHKCLVAALCQQFELLAWICAGSVLWLLVLHVLWAPQKAVIINSGARSQLISLARSVQHR